MRDALWNVDSGISTAHSDRAQSQHSTGEEAAGVEADLSPAEKKKQLFEKVAAASGRLKRGGGPNVSMAIGDRFFLSPAVGGTRVREADLRPA